MKNSEKIKILYIDDETIKLKLFERSLKVVHTIFTASNTTEALEYLRLNPDIRIIFCDQRMPEQTGVEFFEEIKHQFPLPTRILITAYSDINVIIEAVNRGNIYRYLQSPWTDIDMASAVDEGNKFYETNLMLSTKNAELNKAYDELGRFTYGVSNDMRGPLLGILGAVDVAQHIDDLDEIREMMGLMAHSVKELDNYIQNIHNFYNLKRAELNITDISLQDLIEEQENTYKEKANSNNIKFITNLSQQDVFRSDIKSLKIVLDNLVSNAFKYQKKENPDKVVELSIKNSPEEATIIVKDNGIGIPPERINNIFNIFFGANPEETGSCYGLYNVKMVLSRLNGEIKTYSNINMGTTFKVTIPNMLY